MEQAAPFRPGVTSLTHIVFVALLFIGAGCGEAETPPVANPTATTPTPAPTIEESEETPNTAPAEPQRAVRLAVHIPEEGMAEDRKHLKTVAVQVDYN